MAVHGGLDQQDREYAIQSFKASIVLFFFITFCVSTWPIVPLSSLQELVTPIFSSPVWSLHTLKFIVPLCLQQSTKVIDHTDAFSYMEILFNFDLHSAIRDYNRKVQLNFNVFLNFRLLIWVSRWISPLIWFKAVSSLMCKKYKFSYYCTCSLPIARYSCLVTCSQMHAMSRFTIEKFTDQLVTLSVVFFWVQSGPLNESGISGNCLNLTSAHV